MANDKKGGLMSAFFVGVGLLFFELIHYLIF